MEAPEGFRNSDEDHFSESQVSGCVLSKEPNIKTMLETRESGGDTLVFALDRSRVWRMCRT